MWYCEVVFTSGNKIEVPFKNEEAANSYYKMLEKITTENVFIKSGYHEDNINMKNVEIVKKPKKFEA